MTTATLDPEALSLMYLFGSFRPSERTVLLAAANDPGRERAFMAALSDFLGRWAEADWLEVYNVERVGAWIAAQAPRPVIDAARVLAVAASRSNRGAQDPYGPFLVGLDQSHAETRAPRLEAADAT